MKTAWRTTRTTPTSRRKKLDLPKQMKVKGNVKGNTRNIDINNGYLDIPGHIKTTVNGKVKNLDNPKKIEADVAFDADVKNVDFAKKAFLEPDLQKKINIVPMKVKGRVKYTPSSKLDQQFARLIRKLDKKVILVANKSELQGDRQESYEFLKLGFGQPRTISALTGYACLSLLDEVVSVLPTPVRGERREERPVRFAILGRPNAGKSTLLNRLFNE